MKNHYETVFGCEISLKNISDELFNVCVQFGNDLNTSTNFTINRKEEKIIGYLNYRCLYSYFKINSYISRF